ncbi:MAG: TetR/AcrR family transcriptional regulator [Frankiaceae bacterium]
MAAPPRSAGQPATAPVGRSAGRPAGARADKPAAILDAALSLFGERSVGGTAVPAIAARAGVAVGTLYRYWPSKEALVNALYQRWKGALAVALAPAAEARGPARAVFAAWFGALWDFAAAHPAAFAFVETHHHDAYLDAASRALDAQLGEAARRFAERAGRSGEIAADDPELLIALVLGAVTGVHRAAGQGRLALTPGLRDATEARLWAMLRRLNYPDRPDHLDRPSRPDQAKES